MTPKTTRARKNLGDSAERVAALALEQRGYRILARNFRTRTGELDLVAADPDGIAFIEVRARRGGRFGEPEESLTARKRTRLLTLAQQYLEQNPSLGDCAWRIDLVAVELDRSGNLARLDIIKNAVEE